MPARDLARIAYCMLQGGRWGDRQVIPKWFVDETAAPTHKVTSPEMRWKLDPRTFSHGWELAAVRSEGIPADARYKPGSGGQLVAFVPSLDLVISRQTGSSGEPVGLRGVPAPRLCGRDGDPCVLRSEPPADRLAVQVRGARNEWVSFQILMRSDEPVKGVRIEAGDLRGPDGASIRETESRLYRQHQLHLEVGTHRNDTFKPDWYPDPLIPFPSAIRGWNALDANARFVAVPFDLPAGETHGFWVDLHVPAGIPAGEYQGTYAVTAEGGKRIDIPVALTVWDFTLPATPTLATAFGSPAQRMRSYYRERAKAGKETEPSDWQAVEAQCAQLLSEHRLNATPPAETLRPIARGDGSFRIPSEQVRALREFIDRYHVNAIQVPHPSSVVKDPQVQSERLRAWLAAFDGAAKELDRPHVVLYIYLKDEPNTEEDYRYVQTWGRAIREAKSAVQVLVVEQTWTEPGKGGADSAWATSTARWTSGVRCSRCIARTAPQSGRRWARRSGPIPRCARARPRPGGTSITRCSTIACRRGWPGATA
jgi:hypothetical protein